MSQNFRIRIIFTSYDGASLKKAVDKTMSVIRPTGCESRGPIPMPTKKEIVTVHRSPHVYSKSREQFIRLKNRCVLDLYAEDTRPVEALKDLELPSNIHIELNLL